MLLSCLSLHIHSHNWQNLDERFNSTVRLIFRSHQEQNDPREVAIWQDDEEEHLELNDGVVTFLPNTYRRMSLEHRYVI